MPPIWTWAFWNSPLVTTIIAALVLSSVVAITAAILSHRWEIKRKLFDFQLETFRHFNDSYADLRARLTELPYLRKTVDANTFERIQREFNYKKKAFVNMDDQIDVAFYPKRVSDELGGAEIILDGMLREIRKSGTGPLPEKFEALHIRFMWEMQIIKMRMLREMGLMERKECDENIARTKELIETLT